MELILALVIAALVIFVLLGAVTYKWGQPIGSRKGYGVGRARGRSNTKAT